MEANLRSIKIAEGKLVLKEPSTELTLGIGSKFQQLTIMADNDQNRAKKRMEAMMKNPVQEKVHIDLTLDDDDDNDDNLPEKKKKVMEVGESSRPRANIPPLPPQQIIDRRKINRMISNRLSAKRSRDRKNEYVAELEKQATYLENKIAVLRPQVMAYEHQRRLLMIEQHDAKYRVAFMDRELILKEMETKKMRDEIRKLHELHEEIRAADKRTWGADMTLMCPNPNSPPSKPVFALTSSSVQGMEVDSANYHIKNGKVGKAWDF